MPKKMSQYLNLLQKCTHLYVLLAKSFQCLILFSDSWRMTKLHVKSQTLEKAFYSDTCFRSFWRSSANSDHTAFRFNLNGGASVFDEKIWVNLRIKRFLTSYPKRWRINLFLFKQRWLLERLNPQGPTEALFFQNSPILQQSRHFFFLNINFAFHLIHNYGSVLDILWSTVYCLI